MSPSQESTWKMSIIHMQKKKMQYLQISAINQDEQVGNSMFKSFTQYISRQNWNMNVTTI